MQQTFEKSTHQATHERRTKRRSQIIGRTKVLATTDALTISKSTHQATHERRRVEQVNKLPHYVRKLLYRTARPSPTMKRLDGFSSMLEAVPSPTQRQAHRC